MNACPTALASSAARTGERSSTEMPMSTDSGTLVLLMREASALGVSERRRSSMTVLATRSLRTSST